MYEMSKNTKLWVYHNNTFGEYLFMWIKVWCHHADMQMGSRLIHSTAFPGSDFTAENRGTLPAQIAASRGHLEVISCSRSWELVQAIRLLQMDVQLNVPFFWEMSLLPGLGWRPSGLLLFHSCYHTQLELNPPLLSPWPLHLPLSIIPYTSHLPGNSKLPSAFDFQLGPS